MKASPLLRAWLARLDGLGLTRHTRWRWNGWTGAALCFDTPDGPRTLTPDASVLALGGASWARLGSDGAWGAIFDAERLPRHPFSPSNSGLGVQWSDHMTPHFGAPLKNVTFHAGPMSNRGEAILSRRGLEGGGLYPLTPALRDGHALTLDLLPDLDTQTIARRLKAQGKQSINNRLRRALSLTDACRALVMEMARPLPGDPTALARTLKALPIDHAGLRPMDEAISTAGGVPLDALDETLMLKARPGTFCAGEMLDWEAPTGGYLITACLATGQHAGRNAANWLRTNPG